MNEDDEDYLFTDEEQEKEDNSCEPFPQQAYIIF